MRQGAYVPYPPSLNHVFEVTDSDSIITKGVIQVYVGQGHGANWLTSTDIW